MEEGYGEEEEPRVKRGMEVVILEDDRADADDGTAQQMLLEQQQQEEEEQRQGEEGRQQVGPNEQTPEEPAATNGSMGYAPRQMEAEVSAQAEATWEAEAVKATAEAEAEAAARGAEAASQVAHEAGEAAARREALAAELVSVNREAANLQQAQKKLARDSEQVSEETYAEAKRVRRSHLRSNEMDGTGDTLSPCTLASVPARSPLFPHH